MWLWLICGFLITTFADPADNILVQADKKARAYCEKLSTLMPLSDKQQREIYRLRFELSLAIHLAWKEHKTDEEKLQKKIAQAQSLFHAGMKRVLNSDQYALWDSYRKERYAALQIETGQIAIQTDP